MKAKASLHQAVVQVLADLYEKEMLLEVDTARLDDELLAITEKCLELEQKRRSIEEQLAKQAMHSERKTAPLSAMQEEMGCCLHGAISR